MRLSGRERREQLIGVGRQVFADLGYAAASVEEIADRAGVSKPVVYEHFGGKEGLYAVVVDREVEHLLRRIVAALEGADHPRVAVEHAAMAFLTYIEQERDGFRILVHDAPGGASSGTLASVIGDVAAQAESLLADEFRGRGYDPSLAALYARALVGMVALVGEWWLEVDEPDRATVAAHLVNLAWNGLKALDPSPVRRTEEPGPAA
ncbi:MAG TPA: TetR/AcrR family transcriptional regulator [Nitriliruptorales bacterium]|nr:TetR/AcrR family transcriptional regulator [Nitriliruptorales bacterium]